MLKMTTFYNYHISLVSYIWKYIYIVIFLVNNNSVWVNLNHLFSDDRMHWYWLKNRTISKYSMPFCLISEIIYPRQVIFNDTKRSWILSYWGWIILILNKSRRGIFVLLYTPTTKQNLGWMLTRQRKFQWQHNFLFFSKKVQLKHIQWQHTGTINLDYLNCTYFFYKKPVYKKSEAGAP